MANTYEIAKAARATLEAERAVAGAALKNFPRLSNGLAPDAIRVNPAYQSAKASYDLAFQALRKFNGQFLKVFAREIKQERKGKVNGDTCRPSGQRHHV